MMPNADCTENLAKLRLILMLSLSGFSNINNLADTSQTIK